MGETRVYVESGSKRVIVCALDWPGWCRSGRTEEDALAALLTAAPRYSAIARLAGLSFDAPQTVGELIVAHRLPGNASTDFGAPGAMPPGDAAPLDPAGVALLTTLLRGCWSAFDNALAAARGKELAKGPRGGGREPDGIRRHVLESESSYAGRIGLKLGPVDPADAASVAGGRQAMLDAMAEVAPLGVPPPGPRGGARWSARYFARIVAYHLVDHIWEIEDRAGLRGVDRQD
jgi:hypothetical protein